MNKVKENDFIISKLRNIFLNTIKDGTTYNGSFTNIDYFRLRCTAASNLKLFDLVSSIQICMFLCNYKSIESVLGLISIPMKGESDVGQNIIHILKQIETAFCEISFMKADKAILDGFIYIVFIVPKGDIEKW